MSRYLYKEGESPRYVHIWTPALALRKDMVECDAKGVKLGKAAPPPPQPEKVELPLTGIVDAPPFVPPAGQDDPPAPPSGQDETPAPPAAQDAPPAGHDASADDEAFVLMIQSTLSALKATEIRHAIKTDFDGAKVPAGLSKLQLVEAYIQLARAKKA